MRGGRDEFIWETITEKNCYTFTNFEGDTYSRTKKRGDDGHGSPRGLMG